MSQLNIYITNDMEKQIRAAAKKEGKTISSFVSDLIKRHFPESKGQKNYFSRFFGKWEGELPEVKRALPQQRDEP